MKRFYSYDKKNFVAKFGYIEKGIVTIGKAKLDPRDIDVESEKTGLTIAEFRAKEKRLTKRSIAKSKLVVKLENEIIVLKKGIEDDNNKANKVKITLENYLINKEKFQQRIVNRRKKEQPIEKAVIIHGEMAT